MMSMNVLSFFACLSSIVFVAVVDGQGTRKEPFPLNDRVAESCTEMIATHTFEFNCCSLRDTELGGCEISVINGRCRVRGPVWFLDFTSDYVLDECPDSEYVVMTEPPSASPPDSAASIHAVSNVVLVLFMTTGTAAFIVTCI